MSQLGEVLETVRRARGMTQEELAKAASVTQAALSRYENDQREPDEDVLVRLAEALGITVGFLRHASRARGAMAIDVHMRRHATAKPTVWRQLEAQLNVFRMHALQLFEEVSLRSEQRVPTFDPIDTDPTTAARLVRAQWRMPTGPVRDLSRWLESAGIVIIEQDLGTARVDGLSLWVEEHPVMLLNTRPPMDRRRLTAGHELGHLCLHSSYVSEEMEREATEFAAEFLMPAEEIRPQLRNLTIGKLKDLKREWRVSMQALVERAFQLHVMTASQRTNLYKSMSANGWRIHEPVSDEIPLERAKLPQLIGNALHQRGLSVAEIAKIAGFSPSNSENPFRPSDVRTDRWLHAV